MTNRNAPLAFDLAKRLGVSETRIEAALADWLIVRFQHHDVRAAARDRGLTLTDDQVEAVMDLVVRRFDPDGEGLTWRAIDAATDEVLGRS
jgi:predicted xylose isomerase-like sugar epimerase